MLKVIHGVLSPSQLERAQAELNRGCFEDGKTTAQGAAREAKRNLQLKPSAHGDLRNMLRNAMLLNAEVLAAAVPHSITSPRIARYEVGMEYGPHLDGTMIEGMRTDVSFTLFLSDPESYDGGDLTLPSAVGEIRVRLPAGSVVLYGTGELHRVTVVTRGCRDVAVGWVQSKIRDESKRAIYAELDGLLREHLGRVGPDDFAGRLQKTVNNLFRTWAEP